MRDARPSDWFIAGMFFTFGVAGAALIMGAIVVVLLTLGLGALVHP